jgi:hypothetical protein
MGKKKIIKTFFQMFGHGRLYSTFLGSSISLKLEVYDHM